MYFMYLHKDYSFLSPASFESILSAWCSARHWGYSGEQHKYGHSPLRAYSLQVITLKYELYKKDLHDPDNHDGVITDLEPDIQECEVSGP